MSVIQKIQERQKWVFGSIAFALIIFVVQDKFMSKGSLFGSSSTIAKVNGEAIDYADFQAQETLTKQIQQQQQQDVDEDILSAQTYEYLVTTRMLNQEYKKLGLVYTNKEFGDAVASNNPPDWFRQQFSDQTGAYNPQTASSKLSEITSQIKKNPNNPQAILFYNAVLQPTTDAELGKKYQALINGAIYIPKWLAEKNAADNSAHANISYINVPYTSVNDSSVTVSDDEVKEYVKNHSKEFETKEESRQIAYLTFDASASPQDTASVIAQLNALKGEFKAATDIKTFLESKDSKLGYSDRFLGKNIIQQPAKDSLFKLQPGEMYGPYLDAGDYVVARMVGIRTIPDSAKVRHILVETNERSQQGMTKVREDSAALKRLDSAIAEIKAGKKFDSVCLKYSDDGSKFKGGVMDFFGQGAMVESFADSSFLGKVGDKKTVHSEFGYHYIEILAQKGSQPAYNIAYLAKPIQISAETDDSVKNAAAQFAGTSRNIKDFYANAVKLKKSPITVGGIKENSYELGNPQSPGYLGKNRQFIKWVYQNGVGDVSEPAKFGQKYIVAIITTIDKPGLPGVETARPLVEQKIKNQKKAKIIADKIKGSTLEAIAQNAATSVRQADSLSFQLGSIPTIGLEAKVIGAAFNKQLQGKISPPIAGETGVFVIKSNNIYGVASAGGNLEAKRKGEEMQLKGNVMRSSQSFEPLRKAADINDYRFTVLK